MTDHPIIFSAAMVRALLGVRKTQTRRLATSPLRKCEVGDRLWVRETFRLDVAYDELKPTKVAENAAVWCCVDGSKVGDGVPGKTRVSIHMPRWASRLTLIVSAVRVEPLQAISRDDAIAEGLAFYQPDEAEKLLMSRWSDGYFYIAWNPGPQCPDEDPIETYAGLWRQLHKGEGQRWSDNPEVVALTFRIVRGNIDRIEG